MLRGFVDRVSRSLVCGWAADTDNPDQAIEVVIRLNGYDLGVVLANRERDDLRATGEFGGGRHGFVYRFDYPIPLNLIGEITVEFLEDRSILPPGPSKILAVPETESHSGAQDARQGRPNLLLMTTMGRSGGTMVMEKIGTNPEVILADVYPYETRVLAYYAAAYRALISPADHSNSINPDDLMKSNLRLGFNPYFHSDQEWRYDQPEFMYDFFEITAARHLAQSFRDLVSEYYERRATLVGKKPRYFIEKCGVDDPARHIGRAIFPDARELVLLRHPRDVICSQMAFWGSDFHGALMGMAVATEAMMLIKQSGRSDTFFVRYEDIIATPDVCANDVARFLGVGTPINFESSGREGIRAVHATTKSAADSVSRWRKDLNAFQISECRRVLGKYEEYFGYGD
ncbi:MAG: sulfotransferase [Azospirillaceae bacterium]|nr:sulfotransferase [Azospirillaceae bacterium]